MDSPSDNNFSKNLIFFSPLVAVNPKELINMNFKTTKLFRTMQLSNVISIRKATTTTTNYHTNQLDI